MEKTNYKNIDPVIFDYKNRKETCIGCGLTHHEVETVGIYYCPNPLCMVCGTEWFRRKLKSFEEDEDGNMVDPEEWIDAGLRYLKDECKDEEIKRVGYLSVNRILDWAYGKE